MVPAAKTSAVTGNAWYPWLAVSNSAVDRLYTTTNQTTGPFKALSDNGTVISGFTDLSNVKFECTLSPLQRSGSVASTTFY